MHRISLFCLFRAHVEEARVKEAWLIDEAPERCVTGILLATGGIVVSLCIKSFLRHFFMHIKTLLEEVPESTRICCMWEATGHANDCNLRTFANPLAASQPAPITRGVTVQHTVADGLSLRPKSGFQSSSVMDSSTRCLMAFTMLPAPFLAAIDTT